MKEGDKINFASEKTTSNTSANPQSTERSANRASEETRSNTSANPQSSEQPTNLASEKTTSEPSANPQSAEESVSMKEDFSSRAAEMSGLQETNQQAQGQSAALKELSTNALNVLNKQYTRKRAMSDNDENHDAATTKRTKQSNVEAVAPPIIDDKQSIRRGQHMERMKSNTDNKDTSASANHKKRDKKRERRGTRIGTDKHAPYFGAGQTFKWEDNPTVSKEKAKVGTPNPSLLKIKLTNTNGKVYPSAKFVRHAVMDWTNPSHIKDLNKWRNQFIDRTLNKHSTQAKSSRPRWSSGEMLYISLLMKKAVLKKKASLSKSDWVKIAKRMNERFEGTVAKKGEQVPNTKNARGVLVKGDVLRKDHRIPKRSFNAMKNQASRWPEVVKMINDTLEKVSSSSEEDIPSPKTKKLDKGKDVKNVHRAEDMDSVALSDGSLSSDSDSEDDAQTEEDDEEGKSMDIDHDLEGESDNEMDGQRPAGNSSGGILVVA